MSTQAQVKSAEFALNGVREAPSLGQRTTLDVYSTPSKNWSMLAFLWCLPNGIAW